MAPKAVRLEKQDAKKGLFAACRIGDIPEVARILTEYPQLANISYNQEILLEIASRARNIPLIEVLFAHGVTHPNRNGHRMSMLRYGMKGVFPQADPIFLKYTMDLGVAFWVKDYYGWHGNHHSCLVNGICMNDNIATRTFIEYNPPRAWEIIDAIQETITDQFTAILDTRRVGDQSEESFHIDVANGMFKLWLGASYAINRWAHYNPMHSVRESVYHSHVRTRGRISKYLYMREKLCGVIVYLVHATTIPDDILKKVNASLIPFTYVLDKSEYGLSRYY